MADPPSYVCPLFGDLQVEQPRDERLCEVYEGPRFTPAQLRAQGFKKGLNVEMPELQCDVDAEMPELQCDLDAESSLREGKPESDDAGSDEMMPVLEADIDAGDDPCSQPPPPPSPIAKMTKRKRQAKPKAKPRPKGSRGNAAAYPPGDQKTLDDFYKWADDLFRALKQYFDGLGMDSDAMWEALSKITVVLTTSYSGAGSAEWSLLFLLQAFRGLGYNINIIIYSACDNDKHCQRLLMSHHQRPMHIFSELTSRLPADALFDLKTLQNKYIAKEAQEHRQANLSGQPFTKKQSKEVGDAFFEEACLLLSEVKVNKDTKCWCVACNEMCKVFPSEVLKGNAIWIEIGGNTCTPWSVAGATKGWLDPNSIPALVWGWWLGQTRPTHVINECTPTWPALQFWTAFMAKVCEIQHVRVCPSFFAVPARRHRLYTVVSRTDVTQKHFKLDIFFPSYLYRTVVTDANIFFCAQPEVQSVCLAQMLATRGIAVEQHQVINDMRLVISFANRQRRSAYKKKYLEQGSTGPKLCNLSQNASFRKKLDGMMPTLLKNSNIWNFELNKILLGPEHFIVNGAPIFCQGHEGITAMNPEVIVNMPYARAVKITGNMMHITVVGMVLGSILFGTSHADVTPWA